MHTPDTPRLGIATVCLSGTLEDKLHAAAAAGFHGVEIFENDLVVSPWSPAEVRRACADLGLRIDLYQPFRDFEGVPPDVLKANLRRAEHKFDVMEQLGADTMLVCSTTSPDAVDDDDLAAEQLHMLAERAADRGIRIAYEALAWGRFVNTYDHSWRIVRKAAHPALGLCLDSFHVLSKGSDIGAIRVIPGSKIFFLQLADAPWLNMDVLQWSRHHRLFPGQGSFDLPEFVNTVLGTGYDGPLSLEVFNDVVRQADPGPAAVDAMRSLITLVPGELPEAPKLTGHTYTEVSVDDASGPEVTATLQTLGFVHVGQHRSEPVQLWQQETARILVKSGQRKTAITALGVDSTDPAASVRRAKRLLAGDAPGGVVVRFCQPSWLDDFTSLGTVPSGLLKSTDHVALTEDFDDFNRAALFYRSVLGLRPEPDTEFAAPYGLIRSQALTGAVRIALNAAVLRRGGWAPAVEAPQHVAFLTDDAIAAAKALRSQGAPLLEIPGNYYDDLDARLAPPAELLDALRACSVLYDRDDHGEFLHFYTEILGSRVFFEVVQRIDGYDGYGAVNSPVRMAAHRQRRLSKTLPHRTQRGID
jgi:3-dehydroshikimate dehydratase